MGMSASQARLLSLTARQSNLEFEGQQINQQRTCLSNQSANYYNSLLTMTVPTPPSTDDYTTVKYEFTIGGNTATIGQVLPQDQDGNYLVTYTTTLASIGIQENTAYKISATANASSEKKGLKTELTDKTTPFDEKKEYYVKSFREDRDNTQTTVITKNSLNYDKARFDGNTIFFDQYGNEIDSAKAKDGDGNLLDGYSALVVKRSEEVGYSEVYVKLSDVASYKMALSDANGGRGEKVYEFQENTTEVHYGDHSVQTLAASNQTEFSTVSSEYKEAFENAGLDINEYYQYKSSTGIRFAKKTDIEKSANTSGLTISTFAVASLSQKQTHTLSGVQVEFDTSGRIATITDVNGNTYTMTASTITDDAAYEDAYNQYTYDQYVYDQTQNEINANIEILQAQDKNLELRLSQLNTEHSAIQTEMDAVNKVLSKNIETSFKTFNA